MLTLCAVLLATVVLLAHVQLLPLALPVDVLVAAVLMVWVTLVKPVILTAVLTSVL